MILLSLSFAFVYLRILSYSFFLSFLIFFFFSRFFFYHRLSLRSAIQRIRMKRVYVFICVHIPRGSDIVYGIQYLLLLHAYAISLFFSFSRLFSFLRFLFLPYSGFHFSRCFSFLHSINLVRIGFFLWRPSNLNAWKRDSNIHCFLRLFILNIFRIEWKYLHGNNGWKSKWMKSK